MRLHHIAYVTDNLEAKAESFCQLLGFTRLGQPEVDEKHGVRILFLDMGNGEKLELLEPWGDNSPIQRHLQRGGGLYHLCFEVDDLAETLEKVQKDGQAWMVREPTSAPAMGHQSVAFVVTKDHDLIEFVQAAHKHSKK